MAFDPKIPYNDLPPLPPKSDVETKAILKKTIVARSALAELKGLGKTLPNQALLLDSLILQEAKASSEIENIITTSDALFRAFTAKTKQIDPATKEVLRYREALWKGYNILKDRPGNALPECGALRSAFTLTCPCRGHEEQPPKTVNFG